MARAFHFRPAVALTAAAIIIAAPLSAAQEAAVGSGQPSAAKSPDKICKYDAAPEAKAKPYQLCLTKAAWAAKEKLDAQDATRIQCHYVAKTGAKFETA